MRAEQIDQARTLLADTSLSVAEVAERVGVSPPTLRQHGLVTPRRPPVTAAQVEHARQLLTDPRITVIEAAAQVGASPQALRRHGLRARQRRTGSMMTELTNQARQLLTDPRITMTEAASQVGVSPSTQRRHRLTARDHRALSDEQLAHARGLLASAPLSAVLGSTL